VFGLPSFYIAYEWPLVSILCYLEEVYLDSHIPTSSDEISELKGEVAWPEKAATL
jgi:hypothetical protein